MSSTRLPTHAPIGIVTKMGWSGCPYGPATLLTGRFACISSWRATSTARGSVRVAIDHLRFPTVRLPDGSRARRYPRFLRTETDDARVVLSVRTRPPPWIDRG